MGFLGPKKVGCGIFWVKNCGMWDFLGEKKWDVGFLDPPFNPPHLSLSDVFNNGISFAFYTTYVYTHPFAKLCENDVVRTF